MPRKALSTLGEEKPAANAHVLPASLAAVDALYVHVPFCFHKCHYCDFYSITRQSPQRMEDFVDLLLREADLWLSSAGNVSPPRIRTIFFGGGTPSLLPLETMRRLLRGIHQRFDLTNLHEWTVEVNPATAELDYCRMLRETGVDRLSFGAQSFDRAQLAMLERHHDPQDVPRSMEIARAAGFSRLNVDLIYAIPGQDLESWANSLQAALALNTPHISCYNLTYESNTPMAVRKRLGHFQPVDEQTELEMFHHARRTMISAGCAPYEISNYAHAGEECRHNLHYWTGGNYIGLGPSAASHVEGQRWRNRPHLGEWERAVREGQIPAIEVEQLSSARRAGELAMLMLRLAGGIEYSVFADRTGLDARTYFAASIAQLSRAGLLVSGPKSIYLTETGINVADAIGSEFLSPT